MSRKPKSNGETDGLDLSGQDRPVARTPLTPEEAAQRAANRKVYYLVHQSTPDAPSRIVKEFANRYRLKRWWDVAVTISPEYSLETYVIVGRRLGISESMQPKAKRAS